MIKSSKRAIYAVLKDADINDGELQTTFIGVESLMNSRLLTTLSDDPNDEPVLTPNNFLIGQMGGDFIPESVDSTAFNPRKRWRRVQELTRHVWERWMKEYYPTSAPVRSGSFLRRTLKLVMSLWSSICVLLEESGKLAVLNERIRAVTSS